MSTSRLGRGNTIALCGWSAFFVLLLVSNAGQNLSISQEQGVDGEAEQAAASAEYRPRYLKSYLKLMEISLQRDKQIDAKAPGTIPAALLTERERRVEAARKMLQAVQGEAKAEPFRVFLYLAEAAAQTADADYRRWAAVRQRAPGALSALDLEYFQAQAELAQITWEEGTTLVKASREQQNAWKINLILDELVRLHDKVERSTMQNSYRTRYVYPLR